jgi:hypothetical protein
VKVYVANTQPTGVIWRSRNAWPCSVVEGEVQVDGVTHTITKQELAGPKVALGLPRGLAPRALLAKGIKTLKTVKHDNSAQKPRKLAGGEEPEQIEETATELIVGLELKNGVVVETKKPKPAPKPVL